MNDYTTHSTSARLQDWWASNEQALNPPPHRANDRIPRQAIDAYHAAH